MSSRKTRVLIIVNVDWFFLSHRLPIALAAAENGYEVHIATGSTGRLGEIARHGLEVHEVPVDRSGAGILSNARLLGTYFRIMREIRPDVVHLVTIKPVLLGGMAVRLTGVRRVIAAISGLGHVFLSHGVWGALRRRVVGLLYRFVLSSKDLRVIFQNRDDFDVLRKVAALAPEKAVFIPGSGVDLQEYSSRPLPDGPAVFLMVSRLLVEKGVLEYVEAAKMLLREGVDASFLLAGDPDPGNPSSIGLVELERLAEGKVKLLGHRTDVADLMSRCHVVVLPSYREGFPRVLIEAAACGRAVITTDVPGCADAIRAGETGLAIPAKDAKALAHAMRQLLLDRNLCRAMGAAGRRRAESLFDVGQVIKVHLALYAGMKA